MAAVVGFKTIGGYFFNSTVKEEEIKHLNGRLCIYNSIKIFEDQRKENHLQVPNEDTLAEVTLGGYPVCAELGKLYQEVNGTMEEVQPASSSNTTSAEGIPNEDVVHEDDGKKIWSHTKVKALIRLYEENKASFDNHFIKRKDVWQKITTKLNTEGGMTFTVEEVDKKWRNLKDRYRRIFEMNRQTGMVKSNWQYFNLMDQLLQNDPAVNPPCIAQAGCSYAVETTGTTTPIESSQEQTVSPQVSWTSTPLSAKKKLRSNDDDAPWWAVRFMEGAEAQNKKARKLLKKVYKQEKRRNDLFERYLNMKSSSNNDNT
uniref:MADF domain-containing protein n=1 Tax=Eptatretus burgeri TaxID=7764 RepID=A0A8C4QFU9_EPTBU